MSKGKAQGAAQDHQEIPNLELLSISGFAGETVLRGN